MIDDRMLDGEEGDEDLDGRIAIIGMAGRFPSSPDLTTFWDHLRDGVEAVRFYSDEELLAAGESQAALDDNNYVRAAAPLADIDQFDAGFFGMSPRDAAVFDPQHRFFLECAWEAFEHAGVVPASSTGSVGVFASCGMSDYMFYNVLANAEMRTSVGEWLIRHTGNDTNFLATRVSYEMDLRGPSMNVQTACSSTLVAVHQACQSILSGECDMALAGGAVVSPVQDRGYLYKVGEILSPDGHCRAFDEKSAGTILSSAAGCVLLKPLRAALDDGDNVLAVIRGSAINNDGRAKVGYLAPSVDGQAAVVTEALSVSGVDARDVSYIEAHGTGTLIGDPIEIAALTQAYRLDTDDTQYCAIGSLKTNIGHTGEASGIGALIKTVLSLQHRQLPPSLHFHSPNPQADLPSSPFFVNAELREWTVEPGTKRIAGITNLGAGGTNAHMIVEEAPVRRRSAPTGSLQLVTVSARSDAAAVRAAHDLAEHLRTHPDVSLGDVAYTRLAGRRQFRARRAVVAASVPEAIAALESGDARTSVNHHRGSAPSVVFLAPGGGAQYPGMGRDLYDQHPSFRQTIDDCAAYLRRTSGIDLLAALYPAEVTDESARALERPSIALPALYATTLATAAMLGSWGITPAAMIGHSAGEYAVASLAGVFSRNDGLALVALRGRLFETLAAGGMLSVALGEDALRTRLLPGLSIAAVNAADLCVASGPVGTIAELEASLRTDDIDCSRVHIDVAAHSSMLDPILAEFEAFCHTIRLSPPTVPYVSNLSGDWVTAAEVVDPRYWVEHLRGTVRFRDGIERILADANRALVEIGPGRTLVGFAQRAPNKPASVTPTLRHPREDVADMVAALRAVGRIWTSGVDLDPRLLAGDVAPQRIPLPTYPFERSRYWVDPDPQVGAIAPSLTADLVKRRDITDWFYVPGWRRSVPPPPREREGPYRWMIVEDGSRVAKDLAVRLGCNGDPVVTVRYGSRFRQVHEDHYELEPGQRTHWTQLFDAVRQGRGLPDHIVHISAVAERRLPWERRGDLAAYDELVHRDEAGLIFLAQAVSSFAHSLRLTVVTSGVHAIDGTESLHPERALLHGVARVIPRELAHVRTNVIDVDLRHGVALRRSDTSRIVELLADELGGDAADDVAAYRSGSRWIRAFDPVRLHAAAAPSWPREGVVLITGGLGGVGLAVAEGIARESPGATLVLVGRTPLPEEATWPGLLAEPLTDPLVRHRIESVHRIRSTGATALVIAADVTDLESMRLALARVRQDHGRIHTVVHSAGVLHDALIALRDPAATSSVVDVKARGILNLHELLGETPPQRWVLFSSVSSVLGLPGQVDYTAANAFLDAFAAKVNADGAARALVVNWNAWQEVGMAAEALRTPAEPPPRPRSTSDDHAPVQFYDAINDDGDVLVATTSFSRDRHWLLAEHVVRGGESLIPGTGYLELIRGVAAAGNALPQEIELRDVMFLAPFIVGEHEVRTLTIKYERAQGRVVVYSANEYEPNATAWVEPIAPTEEPAWVDVPAARLRCTNRVERFDGYSDQAFMQFGPRWGVLRSVEYGDLEAIVTTSVPAEFVGELDTLWLHPGVLDIATGSAQALIPGFGRDDTFFVPMSYSRVIVRRPLPAEAVSVVRLRPGSAADIAVFDISVCDEEGLEAVHVEGYTMRRVANTFARTEPRMTQRASALGLESPINEALRVGMLPDEGVDALHRALAANVGPQIVVSSVDLHRWMAKVDAAAVVLDDIDEQIPAGSPSYGRPQLSAAFEEPLTPIESALAKVWRDLLGIDRVGRNDDFFELGGQSLVALRLFAWIRREYAVDMPLSTLFEAPTISQCARVIAAQLGITETPGGANEAPGSSDGPGAETAGANRALAVAAGTAVMPAPAAARSLVAISSAGKGRPLFIVHGAGGNILFLWGLARSLGGDRPIYGFQAMGVSASDEPDATIEEMAARYVRELVAAHDGPFLLGGYSGGGCVALEMTRQLQAMGERVDHVILFDGLPVDLPTKRERRARNLYENIHHAGFESTWNYVTALGRRRIEGLLPQLRRTTNRRNNAEYALGLMHVEGYVDLFDHFTAIWPRYHVGEYDVDVTLLKADEIAPIFAWDYYWSGHIRGSMTIRMVHGDHHTMFYPEHSPGLADAVRTALAEVERRISV